MKKYVLWSIVFLNCIMYNNLFSKDNEEFLKLSRKGLGAYQNYHIQESIELHEKAMIIATKPIEFEIVYSYLANSYFEVENYAESLKWLSEKDRLTNSTRIMHLRGLIYKRLGEYDRAKSELTKIEKYIQKKELSGKRVVAMNFIMKALVQYELGQINDALQSINIAITKLGGDRPLTYEVKVIIQYASGNYKEALSTLGERYVSDKYPDLRVVEYRLWESIVFYNNDMKDEAVKKYKQAALYNKNLPSKDVALDEIISIRGFYITLPDKAIQDLEEIRKLADLTNTK